MKFKSFAVPACEVSYKNCTKVQAVAVHGHLSAIEEMTTLSVVGSDDNSSLTINWSDGHSDSTAVCFGDTVYVMDTRMAKRVIVTNSDQLDYIVSGPLTIKKHGCGMMVRNSAKVMAVSPDRINWYIGTKKSKSKNEVLYSKIRLIAMLYSGGLLK